jgi:hypothetical protein
MRRGSTSTSAGSRPITFRASTSSRIYRGDEHADLAQHQDADEIDNQEIRAEVPEQIRTLLRDDRADQERNEEDDRHRPKAGAVEMRDNGGNPQPPRLRGG